MDTTNNLDREFDMMLTKNGDPDDVAKPMWDGDQYVGGAKTSDEVMPPGGWSGGCFENISEAEIIAHFAAARKWRQSNRYG